MKLDPLRPPATYRETSALVRRWINRGFGVYIIIAALGAGLLTVLVLSLLEPILENAPYDANLIDPQALWLIQHRWWMTLTALPAVGMGLVLLVVKRFGVLWLVLGILALAAPLVVALFCFVKVLAPAYGV